MSELNNNEVTEVEGIDAEQLEELISSMGGSEDKLPPILIDVDDFDKEEFVRGIHEASFLAGKVTALLNTGLSEQGVLDLILSQDSIIHNIEVANINKSMNIEVSKNKITSQEKYEL
jgi:hypothetical protein